jgi:hypothetical protein
MAHKRCLSCFRHLNNNCGMSGDSGTGAALPADETFCVSGTVAGGAAGVVDLPWRHGLFKRQGLV